MFDLTAMIVSNLISIFVGTMFGVFVMALCLVSHDADTQIDEGVSE